MGVSDEEAAVDDVAQAVVTWPEQQAEAELANQTAGVSSATGTWTTARTKAADCVAAKRVAAMSCRDRSTRSDDSPRPWPTGSGGATSSSSSAQPSPSRLTASSSVSSLMIVTTGSTRGADAAQVLAAGAHTGTAGPWLHVSGGAPTAAAWPSVPTVRSCCDGSTARASRPNSATSPGGGPASHAPCPPAPRPAVVAGRRSERTAGSYGSGA